MKLYATTTSERASKGQGGNDFIEVHFMRGSAKLSVCEYIVYFTEDKIELLRNDMQSLFKEVSKGKQKKGESYNNWGAREWEKNN